jgi:hypothetical protein
MDVTGTPAVEVVAAPQSTADIAMSALEALEPQEGGQAAPAAPAAPAADNQPATEPAAAPAAPAGETPPAAATPSPLEAALEGIDPEQLSPEMRAVYDRFIEQDKARHADYTRKTQALAEQRKALEAQQAPAPAAPAAAAPAQPQTPGDEEAELYAALGIQRVSYEEAIESQNPTMLKAYIDGQAQVQALRMTRLMYGMVAPEVQQVTASVQATQDAVWAREVSTYMNSHPELEPYRQEMGQLVTAGYPLEEAGAFVGARYLEPERLAQAVQFGRSAAVERTEKVRDAQGRFSTPSGATKPAGTVKLSQDAPTGDIMMAALEEAGL